jgi:hypothetical protein
MLLIQRATSVVVVPASMGVLVGDVRCATGPFDPKTLYDPFSDRWLVVMVSDAQAAGSSILIGV